MIFRTMPRPDLEVTWYRQNGLFNFTNSDDKPVIGISAQTWEDYLNHIENLPSKFSGQVISPELITITDIPLEKATRFQREISRRILQLCELSRDLPNADFMVGTPSFYDDTELPYNTLVKITNDQYKTNVRKWLLTPSEEGNFWPALTTQALQQPYSTQSLICADMVVAPSLLREDTRHVQVSACWATPGFSHPNYQPPPDEKRYTDAMIYAINQLFTAHLVRDLVVVDRTPPTTKIPPLNCVVQRKI